MRDLLSAGLFTRQSIEQVLKSAQGYRAQARNGTCSTLAAGRKVQLLFVEPSTRTLGSFSEAATLLGCRTELTSGAEATSLVKGEPFGETARMYAGQNANALVLRTKLEGTPTWLAELYARDRSRVAVFNGGDGTNEHPSQALLDLMTIEQYLGRLDDLTVGFVGDLRYSRTVHSDIRALRHFNGINLVLVSAPESALQPWYLDGWPHAVVSQSLEDLRGCDVVYVTRVQRERFPNAMEYERVRGRFVITAEVLESLGPKTIIMHPLPIGDGEIHPSIWTHRQVVMHQQAANGIPTRMALLEYSLTHLDETTNLDIPKPEMSIVQEGSTDEAIRRKREKQKYFRPINEGVVLDHLPFGMGKRVRTILRPEAARGIAILSEGLASNKVPGGRKDALVLEGRSLTSSQIAAIAVLAPTVTINEIHEGKFVKMVVENVPDVGGIGQCPNPNCITRHDIEAALYPHFHQPTGGSGVLVCHYCEQHFDHCEVLN